mmetsp:Transcript_10268/g.18723  ORF Transcript_10268/g.18723 Transcript_10268/m.18723 type:complete len:293 (+) Transcript_10268:1071-1949(+)
MRSLEPVDPLLEFALDPPPRHGVVPVVVVGAAYVLPLAPVLAKALLSDGLGDAHQLSFHFLVLGVRVQQPSPLVAVCMRVLCTTAGDILRPARVRRGGCARRGRTRHREAVRDLPLAHDASAASRSGRLARGNQHRFHRGASLAFQSGSSTTCLRPCPCSRHHDAAVAVGVTTVLCFQLWNAFDRLCVGCVCCLWRCCSASGAVWCVLGKVDGVHRQVLPHRQQLQLLEVEAKHVLRRRVLVVQRKHRAQPMHEVGELRRAADRPVRLLDDWPEDFRPQVQQGLGILHIILG